MKTYQRNFCCPLLQIKPKVFVSPLPRPLLPLHPSFPPTFLVSLLCVGRSSTLAVHVFTNVSEYLIVIIPLSSALRRLSVSKAELHSCGNCYCYFKKLYDYLFWSCLFVWFFLAEVLCFKSRRTSFRVDVWNLRDGGRSVFFIRHWVMPILWW